MLDKNLYVQLKFSRPVYFSGKAEAKVGLYPIAMVDSGFLSSMQTGKFRSIHRKTKLESDVELDASQQTLSLSSNNLDSGNYALVIGSNFYDDSGYPLTDADGMQAAQVFYFKIETASRLFPKGGESSARPSELPDGEKAELDSEPRISVLPSDTHAEIQIDTNYPANMRLWFWEPGDTKGMAYLEDSEKGYFKLKGLRVNKDYHWVLSVSKDGENFHVYEGDFRTVKIPKLVINEVMANPWVEGGSSEAKGEYIELYNAGSETISLFGFRLQVRGEKGRPRRCSLYDRAQSISIAAEGYGLIVASQFDHGLHDFPESTPIFSLGRKTLCGGLSNASGQILELLDKEGRIVSSYGGYLKSGEEGRSVERVSHDAIDGKENFCYSRRNFGPTPGRRNGISVRGCEQADGVKG